MGASLVYLDRPVTKKDTVTGNLPASQTQVGYKYASSSMQGWRLNMVRIFYLIKELIVKIFLTPFDNLIRNG